MTHTLNAKPRTKKGSRACGELRATGAMPAVVYGGTFASPTMVTLTVREFEKVWREAGESTVITLAGLGKEASVLIHEVTVDPIYGTPIHADLFAVRTDQTVEVDVPLVYVGVAPAEKELGGTLIKVIHSLTIEALPKDLPHEIEVDISSLVTFDDQITVAGIVLPSGVTATMEADEVVALVQEAREEEEAPATTADVTAIEVQKKGKAEEEAA